MFRPVLASFMVLLACCGKSEGGPDAAGPMSCADVYLLERDHGDELKSCKVADDCVMLGEIRTSCEGGPDYQIVINLETERSNPRYVEGAIRCNGPSESSDAYTLFDPLDCVLGQCVLPIAGFYDLCNAVGCNPATQAGCDSESRCAQLVESDVPFLASYSCVPEGSIGADGACARGQAGPNGYDNCAAGLHCSVGTCRRFCELDTPAFCDGAPGDTCQLPSDGSPLGENIGLCGD